VDFSGRGDLAARQQALAKTLSKLSKISIEFNVVGTHLSALWDSSG
jgi:hypothetical protein